MLSEIIFSETVAEIAKKDDVIFEEIVGKHEPFMDLEDILKVKEFVSIVPQKVNLVLLSLQYFFFFGELLVFLANDAHRTTNIVLLLFAPFAVEFVDERLFDNFAGLELLGVEDFAGFSYHWEVLGENWVLSDIRECNAVIWIQIEHLFEEVLNVWSAVDGHLFLCLRNGLGIAEIVC